MNAKLIKYTLLSLLLVARAEIPDPKDPNKNGWIRTGDLVFMRDDG